MSVSGQKNMTISLSSTFSTRKGNMFLVLSVLGREILGITNFQNLPDFSGIPEFLNHHSYLTMASVMLRLRVPALLYTKLAELAVKADMPM